MVYPNPWLEKKYGDKSRNPYKSRADLLSREELPEYQEELDRVNKEIARKNAKYSVQDQLEQATNPHAGQSGPDYFMWFYISLYILGFIIWIS